MQSTLPGDSHRFQSRTNTASGFTEQWINPSDVFSILLLLGGDVISRALAQIAGSGIAPVSFSFGPCSQHRQLSAALNQILTALGWVAYSISALAAAVGHNKLMPNEPDCACKIINVSNGYIRDNSSWIVGRVVRDFTYWCDPRVTQQLSRLQDERWARLKRTNPSAERPRHVSIIVSVYEPSHTLAAGIAKHDIVTWIGVVTMVVQLAFASIPLALYGDWAVILVTAAGSVLALATSMLPQWKIEKWACRKNSTTTYVATRGNGAQHAIVILGNGCGLNLEDLASGQTNTEVAANSFTRAVLLGLFVLWVLLLITATGIKDNTWFLLAVGGIGIVQNVFVAGHHRRPESFGLPLDFVQVIGRAKVMDTLLEVERLYENVGKSLLPEFFPGNITEEDQKRWEAVKVARVTNNGGNTKSLRRPREVARTGTDKVHVTCGGEPANSGRTAARMDI